MTNQGDAIMVDGRKPLDNELDRDQIDWDASDVNGANNNQPCNKECCGTQAQTADQVVYW